MSACRYLSEDSLRSEEIVLFELNNTPIDSQNRWRKTSLQVRSLMEFLEGERNALVHCLT
jgi:hypothetical protein